MKLSKLCFRLNKIFPNVMSYYWVMYNHSNRSYKIIYKSKNTRKVIDAFYWKNKDIYMYFFINQDGSDKEKTSVRPSDLKEYIERYIKSMIQDYVMAFDKINTAIEEYKNNEDIISPSDNFMVVENELDINKLC